MNFNQFLKMQEKFSNLFYDKNKMNAKEKEEMLKTLSLALHHEVSQIISSSNYKFYDRGEPNIDLGKVLYKSVDAFRYLLAVLNLYDIDSKQFEDAFYQKDSFLRKKSEYWHREVTNKPIAIVDIDDVILGFRNYFDDWLEEKYKIPIERNSKQYYSSVAVKDIGLSPEMVFEEFIKEGELLNIPVIEQAKDTLKSLRELGYEIHLLTSRPERNLICRYHTCQILLNNNIVFDKLNFSSEKYIWLSRQDFYLDGRFKFAIDDSAKHSLEYANHGVKVVVPKMSYNSHLDHENIQLVEFKDFHDEVVNLAKTYL